MLRLPLCMRIETQIPKSEFTGKSRTHTHGGQGESPVPPHTRGSVSLSRADTGQGETLMPRYTRGSVSLSMFFDSKQSRGRYENCANGSTTSPPALPNISGAASCAVKPNKDVGCCMGAGD